MEEVNYLIIGAGIIGLAIAESISDKKRNIIVIERNANFGKETSSRNSEIIHSGIYYPSGSFKAKFCVEGNELTYDICEKANINYKRTGKLIVVTNKGGVKELENLFKKGIENGVKGLRILDKEEIKKIEPNINVYAALYSPATGILDTHSMMKYFETKAKNNGVVFAYCCEVTGIKKEKFGFSVIVKDVTSQEMKISANVVINCAGLNSDKIAQMLGIDIDKSGYRLHYCKGEYFSVSGEKGKLLKHLVYPRPTSISIGIHTVIDLQEQLKLGPNAFYVDEINYDVDEKHKDEFYNGIKDILPFINKDDLSPSMAGIRPKLQVEGESMKDFVIKHEVEKDLTGFINLIGIESPGLTSAPAIAKYVETIVKNI